MMKLLAISDHYIPRRYMTEGLTPLTEYGIEIDMFPWEHETLEELQEANLQIEQGGPEAVPLPDELYQIVGQYDIIAAQFIPIPRKLLESAPKLKLLGIIRGGVENVDIEAATKRNVAVFNTPGRNARAVAECAVGLILSEIRNLARGHAALKQGIWTRDFPNRNCIPELLGKTVGLVGFGAIARLVATFLDAFGANIIVFDRIRENRRLMLKTPFAEIVNRGIHQSLWRSVNTTLTTLLPITLLIIIGVPSIRDFAIPLSVGILSGLYSSICIGGNLWSRFIKGDVKLK